MKATLAVMVYDVADDKRRTKLHALLKQYGVAVQESAFEGRLTRTERDRLLERAQRILDEREDRFVIYSIANMQEEQICVVGKERPEIPDKTFFIV
jgi:CRISPR-associated protein Cas2